MPSEIAISPDIVNKVSYKQYLSLESIALYYQLDAETMIWTMVWNKHIKTTKNGPQCYSYGRKKSFYFKNLKIHTHNMDSSHLIMFKLYTKKCVLKI
jgi:hypothetical protein